MIETLLGGLLGGAFRLAPEVLKWFDRQGERGHELAMQDKALEFEKLRGAQRPTNTAGLRSPRRRDRWRGSPVCRSLRMIGDL
jgi:hypothetical protein